MWEYQEANTINELLNQYQDSLKQTRKILNKIKIQIDSFEKVCKSPTASKSEKLHAKEKLELLYLDKKVVSSWERNLIYSIDWMKTGRMPRQRRGIERRSVYQNQILVDPSTLKTTIEVNQDIYSVDNEQEDENIDYLESLTEERLSILSERDRDIYLMSVNGMPANEIAEYMGMKYNTIYRIIERARQKIVNQNKSENVMATLDW